MVHEPFYDRILNLADDSDFDRMMAGLGRFVVCNPMVACQHDGFSDNTHRHVNFNSIRKRGNWFSQ